MRKYECSVCHLELSHYGMRGPVRRVCDDCRRKHHTEYARAWRSQRVQHVGGDV